QQSLLFQQISEGQAAQTQSRTLQEGAARKKVPGKEAIRRLLVVHDAWPSSMGCQGPEGGTFAGGDPQPKPVTGESLCMRIILYYRSIIAKQQGGGVTIRVSCERGERGQESIKR